jgi:hypothetical protein
MTPNGGNASATDAAESARNARFTLDGRDET